ncbi:MAG: hypothetical protein CMM63_04950 [Rhodospirillaceae bacterium]|nr:hypothetical protein [Rhodospirillaceae bacterium]
MQIGHDCVFSIAADAASAADLNIKASYGKVQGGGITENDDSIYFGVTARDFDFTIGPAGNGFYVEWTSVIRGGGDPKNRTLGPRQTNARSSRQPNRASGRRLSPKIPSPMVNCVGRA